MDTIIALIAIAIGAIIVSIIAAVFAGPVTILAWIVAAIYVDSFVKSLSGRSSTRTADRNKCRDYRRQD